VFWGNIVPLADGVVVQPLLSPLWTVSSKVADLSVTVPRYRYELPPIILRGDLLKSFETSSVLKLYMGEDGGPPRALESGAAVGELGENFHSVRSESDFVLVQPEDEHGTKKGDAAWLYLPNLTGENQIVSFVGGLICLLREDYSGAIDLLQNAYRSSSNQTIKIDSRLFQALAKAKTQVTPLRSSMMLYD
jgi:hypothetical protein